MFVAVNSVRVIGESNIMEEFLKLSENHVTVFVMFPVWPKHLWIGLVPACQQCDLYLYLQLLFLARERRRWQWWFDESRVKGILTRQFNHNCDCSEMSKNWWSISGNNFAAEPDTTCTDSKKKSIYDVYTKVFELLGSTRNLGKSVNTAVETH